MSIEIGSTNNKYNTTITDIKLDGINYKYYYNNKSDEYYQYITSSEQSKEIIDCINIYLSKNKANWEIICKLILTYKLSKEPNIVNIEDKMNIFKVNIKTKYHHNQTILLNNFLSKHINLPKIFKNIPKELILNNRQLANILLTEINKINTNMDYAHYVVCNDILTEISIRFVYNNSVMENFNKKHGYNYFEIKMKLSDLHPYLPPDVSYIKPKIDIKLVSNIMNLDIWKPSSWNYLISLEWIIINLGNILEEHFMNSIDMDDTPFNFIEMKVLELEKGLNKSDINLKVDKIINENPNLKSNKGFKSGTGYGSGNGAGNNIDWDITKYIDISKAAEANSIIILTEIYDYINKNEKIYIPEQFNQYILNKFNSSNLLHFNNNIELFKILINFLDLMLDTIGDNINFEIIDEIKALINVSNIDENYMCVYLHYIDIYEKYNKKYSKKELNVISVDEKDNYIKMIKEQNYNNIDLDTSHCFYKEHKNKVSVKTMMRIMGELSSLKKDLPVNWDSSVIMRMIDTNVNLLSFIIVGPKDTPYHNGLFEFHVYFPDNYPSVVPIVLIKTTDNGRVRFNPNLYSNGKVCLSLLGTWSGQKGESWIPEISSLFQVIISIQSLILVDEPYFNEPGYENSINTPNGKKNSSIYNDNIRYETMKVGMLDMLNNKIPGYEDFITQHFKLKKDEIINVLNKWYDESLKKEKFKNVYDELKKKLNEL